jgi:lipoprotein-anchoring transpeptidase ErfK/SrfK
VTRRVLAVLAFLVLAIAGMLAATVSAGVRPLSLLATTTGSTTSTTGTSTTTTGTTGTTTAPAPPVIAPGVSIGGVRVGGLTPYEAYQVVDDSFSRPLVVVVARHRLAPRPSQLGAVPRIGEAVARARKAFPGARIRLVVRVAQPRVREYVATVAKRFDSESVDAQLFLRSLRPWISKPRDGRALYRRRAEHAIVTALVANRRGPVRLPQKALAPVVTRASFGPVIVIRRGSNRLYLYRAVRQWRIFPVATGQARYPTPLGRFKIVVKWRNPWWYPPSSPWAQGLKPIPPGPGNPLGTRWMGLSAPGVGIHGTPDSASIGYSASHGCIRMQIPDAEWLFLHVEIGTPVFIVAA